MKQGHLSLFLIDGLKSDIQNIQLSKVTNIMESLLRSLCTIRDSRSHTGGLQESSVCVKLLLHCYPMLHQYMQIVEFFAGQLIGVYRVSGKLLSVLLGLFTELASKVMFKGIFLVSSLNLCFNDQSVYIFFFFFMLTYLLRKLFLVVSETKIITLLCQWMFFF